MGDRFKVEVGTLTSREFIALSKAVGWGAGRKYDMKKVDEALSGTFLTIVVRDIEGEAIGCGRAFSDDLLMTFIPDIFVRPEYQKLGVGRMILETIKERLGHTTFYLGSQSGNEAFFEKLGFSRGLPAYTGKFKENPHFE